MVRPSLTQQAFIEHGEELIYIEVFGSPHDLNQA